MTFSLSLTHFLVQVFPNLKFPESFSFVFLFLTILLTAFGLVCYASCPFNSSSSSLVLKVAFMCSNKRPREGEMS